MFEPRMAAHGVDSVQHYVRDLFRYTLEGRAEQIRCRTLVCDNEIDVVSMGQGQTLARHIGGPTEFVRFTADEGAGGHCEGTGREVYDQRVFDWLDDFVRDRRG
jgi:hypothetical protein